MYLSLKLLYIKSCNLLTGSTSTTFCNSLSDKNLDCLNSSVWATVHWTEFNELVHKHKSSQFIFHFSLCTRLSLYQPRYRSVYFKHDFKRQIRRYWKKQTALSIKLYHACLIRLATWRKPIANLKSVPLSYDISYEFKGCIQKVKECKILKLPGIRSEIIRLVGITFWWKLLGNWMAFRLFSSMIWAAI